MKRFALLLFTASSGFSQEIARDVVATSGDRFSVNGISLSWTLGEPVSGTSGLGPVLTQGFQQVDEVSVVAVAGTSLKNGIRVFPNSTFGILHIQIEGDGRYFFQLFNAAGKSQGKKSSVSKKEEGSLDISNLAQGHYFLNVFPQNSRSGMVFRITKKE